MRWSGTRTAAAATAWWIRLLPPTVCRTLGIADFIRVPSPAARTTTAAGRAGLTRESAPRQGGRGRGSDYPSRTPPPGRAVVPERVVRDGVLEPMPTIAPGRGFEPRLIGPKPTVLPLDDPGWAPPRLEGPTRRSTIRPSRRAPGDSAVLLAPACPRHDSVTLTMTGRIVSTAAAAALAALALTGCAADNPGLDTLRSDPLVTADVPGLTETQLFGQIEFTALG